VQLVTKKYTRYEQKLLEEYRRQVIGIEMDAEGKFARKALRRQRQSMLKQTFALHSHPGHHQSYRVDTNMSPEQNFLMTRLPLMDHGF